jgi:quinoprotein glucose dehydrogenase
LALLNRLAVPALVAVLIAVPAVAQDGTWPTFNGDLKAQKYSPLTQITPENVGRLGVAWQMHTGDVASGGATPAGMHMRAKFPEGQNLPATVWSATPIFVNDTLYLGTPFYRIFALEPDTGKTKWTYDTKSELAALTQPDLKNRGVAYWAATEPAAGEPCQKRVYIGTMDGHLHSVDADTGLACADFGVNGAVDVDQWNIENAKWPLSLLQPPTVYEDTLFVGWAGKDWAFEIDPPGTLFALDARTGAKKWEFHTLDAQTAATSGTGNIWASMSVDSERDLLYIPVSSPSPNFYGGARLQPAELATSVTALDTNTGRVVWSRQLVHHDIWDFDIPAAPTLIDVRRNGRTVPAVAVLTKMSLLFIFDRVTGEPLFGMEERPVPQSDVPGEATWPTQPFPLKPEPLSRIDFDPAQDFYALTPEHAAFCKELWSSNGMYTKGPYTPPGLTGYMVTFPSTLGGGNWNGLAYDPTLGLIVTNVMNLGQVARMVPGKGGPGGPAYVRSTPWGGPVGRFWNPENKIPCSAPPFGELVAVDVHTGNIAWKVPIGVVEELKARGFANTGTLNIGGPIMTASGLLFVGATIDGYFRAFESKTGRLLWETRLEASAHSIPMTFMGRDGRQYVAVAAGGGSFLGSAPGTKVVAFALPKSPGQ